MADANAAIDAIHRARVELDIAERLERERLAAADGLAVANGYVAPFTVLDETGQTRTTVDARFLIACGAVPGDTCLRHILFLLDGYRRHLGPKTVLVPPTTIGKMVGVMLLAKNVRVIESDLHNEPFDVAWAVHDG